MKSRFDKRGQVTIFIIIAVIVVAAVALFFVFKDDLGLEKSFDDSSPEGQVQNYVEECLEDTAMNSIYFNSLQGGFYDSPSDSKEASFVSVPIYIYEGRLRIPPQNVLEKELSKAIEDNLNFCLNDFEDFENETYNISVLEDPEVESSLARNKTKIEMNYPIKIEKESSFKKIKDFEVILDFDYLGKYYTAKNFSKIQAEDPEYIPLDQMEGMGEEKGFNTKVFLIENSTDYFYNFIYNSETHKNSTYMYSFVVRY